MATSFAEAGADLELIGITKRFPGFTAIEHLDLTIPAGSFFALLGPSGCGKTTTLRLIAGLEDPTAGRILIGGKDVTTTKSYRRPVNTVFQSYALFPHMTILDNVAFGLKRRRIPNATGLAHEALRLVELDHIAQRRPSQLSGGQQQRVALARAVVNRPALLLLDEPLGALDLKLRRQMQIELKQIQGDVGLTFLHVTHDQEEAMTMADTIAVMNAGVIEQMGAPEELYENPRTTFVANFLGQTNLIEGKITGRSGDQIAVDMHGIGVSINAARAHTDGGEGWVGIRPEKVLIGDEGESLDAPGNTIPGGVVSDVSFTGVSTTYLVRMPWGQELVVFEQNTGRRKLFRTGDKVELSWRPEYAFLLDRSQDASAGAQTN